MKKYLIKDESDKVVADITVHDNSILHVEEVTDNSVQVTNEFINDYLCPRTLGTYANKAIYLRGKFNWELRRDPNIDELILIPTKK
jgi:hypothetical protein